MPAKKIHTRKAACRQKRGKMQHLAGWTRTNKMRLNLMFHCGISVVSQNKKQKDPTLLKPTPPKKSIEITTPHCFVSKSGCSTPNATLLHEVTAQRCIEKKATPALSISNGSSNPSLCRQRYKRPTASAKT